MSIYERYRRTRVPALSGLEQVRARLEAAERRRVAQTAQQVTVGQLLLHDPEVRLAMGPEQEAEAYERLNDLEASIGLPPTPYVDVPKQEFAKQIHAGQVTVAERALPAGERETLLDNLADATIARFGPARVARYLVDQRNQQTLARAAMRQAQGKSEPEATEPPMGAGQWVRSLIEPYAPPAVEDDSTASRGQPPLAAYRGPEPATPEATGTGAKAGRRRLPIPEPVRRAPVKPRGVGSRGGLLVSPDTAGPARRELTALSAPATAGGGVKAPPPTAIRAAATARAAGAPARRADEPGPLRPGSVRQDTADLRLLHPDWQYGQYQSAIEQRHGRVDREALPTLWAWAEEYLQKPLPVPSLRAYGEAWKFSPGRQQWAVDALDVDPSLIMDFGRFCRSYGEKYRDKALEKTPKANLWDLWRYASDTTRVWLQRVWNGPRLKDPNKRYTVQQLRRDHPGWTRKERGPEARRRGWSPEAFDAAWFGYGAKTGPQAGEEVPNLRPIKGDVGVLATLREVSNVELAPPPPEASGRPVTTGVRARAFVEGVGRGIEALFPTLAGSALALESYPVSVVSPGTAQTMREAAGLGFDWAESIMRGGQAAADVRAEPTEPGKTHYIPSSIPLIGGQDIQVPSLQGATAILTDIAPDVAREAAAFLLGAKAAEATEGLASADDIARFIARRTAGWSPEARLAAGRAIIGAGPKNLAFALASGGITGDAKQDAKNLALGAVLFGLMGVRPYLRLLREDGQTAGARPGGERVAAEERGGRRPAAEEEERSASPLHDQARAIQAEAATKLPQFQTIGQEVAGTVGGRFVDGGMKPIESMIDKATRGDGADPSAVLAGMKDVVRGSLVVPDLVSYEAAARELVRRAVEVDSSLLKPKKSGYQGFHVTIDLGNGVRAEIQLHTEVTFELTHGPGGTHGGYEGIRDLLDLPRSELSEEQIARLDEFVPRNRGAYTAALEMPEDVKQRISALRPSGGAQGQ